jgi:hypothetical protein
MRTLILLSALALTALPAPAQLTTVASGRIVDAPASPCNASATHLLECTDLLLFSSTVNLESLEGEYVDLEGNLVLRLGCVALDVTSAVAAPVRTRATALFGFRLNRPVLFTTTAPVGSLVFYIFAPDKSFVPLGQFGSLLVTFSTQKLRGPDISIGAALRSYTIPDDPTLVGVTIWLQTAVATLTPTPEGRLLNSLCFTIQS